MQPVQEVLVGSIIVHSYLSRKCELHRTVTPMTSVGRAINYDEKDPFLCNACGFCKYAKFDLTLLAKPCCAVDPIENEEDRKKVMALRSLELSLSSGLPKGAYTSLSLSLSLSVCLSVCLCLSISVSLCLSISVSLSASLSLSLSPSLTLSLAVHLSFCFSLSLFCL